jgi:tetratricopeptide (TPR) repeat protein
MTPWLRALAFVLVSMSSLSSAHAQNQPPLAPASAPAAEAARLEASAHFREGVELFREGAFRAALIELERAYELFPDYRVLYNIGQTEMRLGEYVEARWAFECYLAKGGPHVDAPRRQEVERQIDKLEERTARIAISVDQQGAQVFLDGVLVGTAPLPQTFPLSVGRHRVFAVGDDGSTASQLLELAGGDFRDVSLRLSSVPRTPRVELAAEASEVERPVLPPVQEPAETVLSRRQRWGIGLLVAGAGVGIGSAALGLHATPKAHRALRDAQEQSPHDAGRIAAATQRFDRYSLATDGLLAGAVGLGLGGAVLLILGDDAAPATGERMRVNVGLTPRSVSVHSTF